MNASYKEIAEWFKANFEQEALGIKIRHLVITTRNHTYFNLQTTRGIYAWYLETQKLIGVGGVGTIDFPLSVAIRKNERIVIDFFNVDKYKQLENFVIKNLDISVISDLPQEEADIFDYFIQNNAKNPEKPKKVNLTKDILAELVYESNRIEGSKLTYDETVDTIENINEDYSDDIPRLEARNLYLATIRMIEIARAKKELTLENLRELHYILLSEINDANAGIFRRTRVYIKNASSEFTKVEKVRSDITQFFAQYKKLIDDNATPIVLAAFLHSRFVGIHPFVDGNGRIARLLMNCALISNGYYPVNISADIDRDEYYEIVDSVNSTHNFAPLIEKISKKVIEGVTINVTINIIKFLKKFPNITIDNLAIRLRINRKTAFRHIQRLQTVGRIQRVGSRKTGHWEVIDSNDI
jgi:Fic family protein